MAMPEGDAKCTTTYGKRAGRDEGERIGATAGPNAVGFFYYSGHGAQDAGTNYLIPE
jgi:uncharacterized caspase-like protein